jgi:16S rRNA (uracil1498-N3)-methyltransferase
MQYCYAKQAEGNVILLDESESKHLQVVRAQVGDEVMVVDGQGGRIKTSINSLSKETELQVLESVHEARSYELDLVFGPPKSRDRLEWLLEKGTEIGVTRFVPVLCEHGERSKLRIDRLEKILISAMKQSQQVWLPELVEMKPLQEHLVNVHALQRYVGHMDRSTQHLGSLCKPGGTVSVLIGPEGDLSEGELKAAFEQNYKPVSLGPNRLRTETAVIAAAQIVSQINA